MHCTAPTVYGVRGLPAPHIVINIIIFNWQTIHLINFQLIFFLIKNLRCDFIVQMVGVCPYGHMVRTVYKINVQVHLIIIAYIFPHNSLQFAFEMQIFFSLRPIRVETFVIFFLI